MLDSLNENLLSRVNLGDVVQRSGRRFANKTMIISGEERISYKELNEISCRAANAFLKMGIKRGDRVSFMTHNCLAYIYCFFGLAKIGGIAAPMNFALKGNEIEYIVNDAGSRMLFVEDILADTVLSVKDKLPSIDTFGWIDFGKGKEKPEGWMDIREVYGDNHPADEPEVFVDSNDQVVMMYTSGTESLPKGVITTHLNYFTTMIHGMIDTGLGYEETMIIDVPLFHVGGMNSLLNVIGVGGTVVLGYAPDPFKTVDMIEKHKVTLIAYPPTVFQMILSILEKEDRDVSSLRKCTNFGAVIPQVIVDRLNVIRPGLEWRNYYGSTEGGGGTGSEPWAFATKGNSIGRPHNAFMVKLVDDDDNEVLVGEVGEIVLRSPAVAKGYWNKPEITKNTRRGGWHHTGDLAYMDEDGYYYFVDRKKDMIKTGGENVSSQEVEGVILRHPKVQQVAIVGLPDEYWGEAVTAVIVPREKAEVSEEEIISFCKERMAGYKVPKRVIFESSVPVNAGGKILKREIRKQYSNT